MAVLSTEQGVASSLDLQGIDDMLRGAAAPDPRRLDDLLDKARARVGLALGEVADLLKVADPEGRSRILGAAREVKEGIYGRRMVLFAPLYASNECANNCLYCAFRRDNQALVRRTLTLSEIARETRALEEMGHKRVLLVFGESPRSGVDYGADAVAAIYATRSGPGEIRRVNVNMAPQTVDGFRRLKDAGIGTYQCFQETYHPEQYRRLHPSGPKADYQWRLEVFDRAFAAGIDDVGLGVLFGLYDYRFDLLALLAHAQYLDERYGVGPHTLSFPRIEPAQNAPAAEHIPYPVSDDELRTIVAIMRLAVPYTGLIMSTRETPQMRRELVGLGVSQLSAASRTYPGGYQAKRSHVEESEQFALGDTRSLDRVVRELTEDGYIPSFCTACYRLGRTGHDFMEQAKPGDIQTFCTPNALLTLQEYLIDYATEETRCAGERAIDKARDEVSPPLRKTVADRLEKTRSGARDLCL